MIENSSILTFFAKSHTSNIHSKGKIATNYLVEEIDIKDDERVLEIGFGTGETLIQLNSLCSTAHLFGVEQSSLMIHVAKNRLKFCGISKKVDLVLLSPQQKLPFDNNFFDKIFAESVFAIQEEEQLKNLLIDCNMKLKSKGQLFLNETLWLDATNLDTAEKLNKKCQSEFGIIQSNSTYLHLKDWIKLFDACNFDVIKIESVERLGKPIKGKIDLHSLLSEAFTKFGKLKSILDPNLRAQGKKYTATIFEINSKNETLMEGKIFILRKKD